MSDPVKHPTHYNQHPSGVECITIVEELTYNCGCAVKYIWRSPYKGKRIEDLRKAIESLELEIARLNRKADLEVELQFPTTPPATLTPPA